MSSCTAATSFQLITLKDGEALGFSEITSASEAVDHKHVRVYRGLMTIYPRYEVVEVICTSGEIHTDVVGMMREAQQEAGATISRETEQILLTEPWGMESRGVRRSLGRSC